jgi:RimJ/RimL family protein N-acetyltransferase
VRIRPWAKHDLPLLEGLLGDPVMTVHIGGPETPEKIRKRHERYLARTDPAQGLQFAIVVGAQESPAGWVGYWSTDWRDEPVFEMGWNVLPAFQRRGVASAATVLLDERMREIGLSREIHAFPSVENPASNGVCRRSGFALLGEVDIEYPRGHPMRSNDWYLTLG